RPQRVAQGVAVGGVGHETAQRAKSGQHGPFGGTVRFEVQIFANAFRIRSGVNGIDVTRAPIGASASLIAFITAPGAPAVPASPTPLAPSCDCSVGVSTCAQMMSGISAL